MPLPNKMLSMHVSLFTLISLISTLIFALIIILSFNTPQVYGMEKPFLKGLIDLSKPYASFQLVVNPKQSIGNTTYTLRFYNDTTLVASFNVNGSDKALLFTVPYNKAFKSLEVTKDDKVMLFTQLNLCNKNNICDINENYYSCPEDCLGALDGVCINETDSICDPDCGLRDKDCVIMNKETLTKQAPSTTNNTTNYTNYYQKKFKKQEIQEYKKQNRYIILTVIIFVLSLIIFISAFRIKPKPSTIQ